MRGQFFTSKIYGWFRCTGGSLVAQLVKNLPAMQETLIRFLGQEDLPEKGYLLHYPWAFFVAQLVGICLQCGRPRLDPWVGKIPWRRERLPSPVFWPEEFHGVYSPWGRKELDTTE